VGIELATSESLVQDLNTIGLRFGAMRLYNEDHNDQFRLLSDNDLGKLGYAEHRCRHVVKWHKKENKNQQLLLLLPIILPTTYGIIATYRWQYVAIIFYQ